MRTLRLRGALSGVVFVLASVTGLLPVAVTPSAVASVAARAATSASLTPQAISTRPARDVLSGVSCTGPSFCVAVGNYTRPLGGQPALAEFWNGTSWRVAPGISGAPLRGVSCTSKSFCMAVGPGVAVRWDGTSWRSLSTPSVDHLMSVSCTRPSFCMGVGPGNECSSGALWNGVRWRDLPMPAPCGPNVGPLLRVSCSSTTNCLAVGYYDANNTERNTLADK